MNVKEYEESISLAADAIYGKRTDLSPDERSNAETAAYLQIGGWKMVPDDGFILKVGFEHPFFNYEGPVSLSLQMAERYERFAIMRNRDPIKLPGQ